jgi:hypothetical protein
MTEYCFVMPMSKDSTRLLWYQSMWHQGHDFKPGDVIIVPERDLLWFVGPDTTDKQIHVLADWIVDEHALMMGRVYQSGPPRPATETRLERTVKDSLL